ncbi:hypothetical protein MFIFM68171_02738 [Madurella fahalii]|uniref:Uncharacterized protein n=1 Tax=Madurella fahalii TaxID=1157608 RepID=A0ABQ0G436_9PEZI
MKFQLVAASAALFAASAAALPAPQTDNHGLFPDVDEWDDAADVEILAARSRVIPSAAANFNFTEDFTFSLDHLFAEIESIPDEILEEGDEALHKWLVEHGNRAGDTKLKRDVDGEDVVEDDNDDIEEIFEDADESDDASVVERRDDVGEDVDEDVEEVYEDATESDGAAIVERGEEDFEDVDDVEEVYEDADETDGASIVERSEEVVEDVSEGDESEFEGLSILERGEIAARASIWKITKCVAAIVQLLATTAVPAAKLLRIKKYIKALGGTKEAVKLLLGATTRAEKLRVGGEILVNLSAELLGISTVKTHCF